MTRPTTYKKARLTKTMCLNNSGEAVDQARMMALIDENQRLREVINSEPVITGVSMAIIFYMTIVRGCADEYAVEVANRVLAMARRVRG